MLGKLCLELSLSPTLLPPFLSLLFQVGLYVAEDDLEFQNLLPLSKPRNYRHAPPCLPFAVLGIEPRAA